MGIGFSLVGRRGVGAGGGGGGGGGGGIARMWCWLPCDPSLQWEQKNYSFTRAANSARRKKPQPVRRVRKQQNAVEEHVQAGLFYAQCLYPVNIRIRF